MSEVSGSSRPPYWPLAAVVLIIAVVVMQIYLARSTASKPPLAARPTTAAPSVAGSPPPAVPPPGAASPPAVQPPDDPRTREWPLSGPPLTLDPSTWAMADGVHLLSALKMVDAAPATALSKEQLQAFETFTRSIADTARARSQAELSFKDKVLSTLSPEQLGALSANEKAVADSAFDAEAFVAALRLKQSGTPSAMSGGEPPTASPTVPAPASVKYSGTYIMAALSYLENSGQHALTPAQAEALLPRLLELTTSTQALAARYAEIPKIFNQKQLEAFVQALNDMRTGQIEVPSSDPVTGQDFLDYLAQRLKQTGQ